MKKILSILLSLLILTGPAYAVCGIDSNAKTVLHLDGSNGGTTITDSELTPKTFTAHSGAVTSTAQIKFGTASGLFVNASSSYIDTPSSTDFDIFNTDSTVDFWIYITAIPGGVQGIVGHTTSDTNNGWQISINSAGKIRLSRDGGTAAGSQPLSSVLTTNQWNHIAVVLSSGTTTIYVNGVNDGTPQTVVGSMNAVNEVLIIGKDFVPRYFDGYIDELRISNVARWTSNFTPPTSAYDTSSCASSNFSTFGDVL